MTASQAPRPRRLVRVRQLAHHAEFHVWLAAVAADVVCVWLPAGLAAIIQLVAFSAMLWMVLFDHRHDRSPCPRCARWTPLDPQREVDARSRWLRAWHYGVGSFGVTAAVLWFVVSAGLVGAGWATAPVVPAPWTTLVWVPAGVWFTANAFANRTHQRLEPWCPWCRDGWEDGGVEESSPVPDPAGSKMA